MTQRAIALVLRYAAKVMYIRLSAFVTRPDIRETILNHRLIFECLIWGTAPEWGGCTVKVHQHTLLDNAYQRKERSWQMPASRTYVVSLSAPYGSPNEASLLSGGNPHLSVPFGAPKEPSVPNASRLKTFDIFDIRL